MSDYRDHPVRSYVRTAGRSRPSRNTIWPQTLLVATEIPVSISASREQRMLLEMFRGVLSLAEAAAHLHLPVSLVAVIASDLVDSGHLCLRSQQSQPDMNLLEKVLAGLRKL
ncbi:DUF742 domain-containing protein [Saccharopolyspora shandongensis]|uniref:DUF742 domain-containing protein n=1 Tax=Saccharopolyspora shandongensis TaxID=418495 RepID=UPI0034048BDE